MPRVVWMVLLVALVALAGFILFLTVTGEPMPLRGFVIVAAILLIAAYPAQRLRERPGDGPPRPPGEP